MAKLKYDAAVVEAILAGTHEAAGWLEKGEPSIDEMEMTVAISAIEAARRAKKGAPLAAARRDARDKRVRKAAGTALHKLKAAGVSIEDVPSRQWRTSGELDAPPPPVAMLGMPDPSGYFPYMMVTYSREEASASAGLAGAGQGYTDSDHAFLSRSAVREILQNAARDQSLKEVPFHVALHFVQRAFDEGVQGNPDGFSQTLAAVPEGLKKSAELLDPLEGQDATLDQDALHATEPLLDPRTGVYLTLEEELLYGSLNELMQAATSELELDEESRTRRVDRIIDDTADKVLNASARRSWTLAMDVVTFLAFRESNRELQRVARHTALALRDPALAGHEIPFVRQWVEVQMQSMISMVMANQDTMDLEEADLEEADLEEADLEEADLEEGAEEGIVLTDG